MDKSWNRAVEKQRGAESAESQPRLRAHRFQDNGVRPDGGEGLSLVSQDRRLPEPEKTVMFVMASPEALITVGMIAPTSKLKLLDAMRIISAVTFEWSATE